MSYSTKDIKQAFDPLGLFNNAETGKETSDLEVSERVIAINVLEAIEKSLPGVVGTKWLVYQITRFQKRYNKFPSETQIRTWSNRDPFNPNSSCYNPSFNLKG